MKIVLVEDDSGHVAEIVHALEAAFANLSVSIVRSEHDFRVRLDTIISEKPDVFIIDIMLRWTRPAPDMPPRPPEVQEGGFYHAGFRCAEMVSALSPNMPMIIYSALDETDVADWVKRLPSTASYLRKESSPDPLLERIRLVTAASG